MPRISKRQEYINNLSQQVARQRTNASLRYFLCMPCDLQDDLDVMYKSALQYAVSHRYIFRNPSYRNRDLKWKMMLYEDGYLNETEFLAEFRMSKRMFFKLHDRIKGDEVFVSLSGSRIKRPSELQLLVFLKFLGSFGNDATCIKHGTVFGIGSGTVRRYVERVADAVLCLTDDTIFWPDVQERVEISARIRKDFSFINCIGIIDGTLFPLEFKPTKDGEDYFTRKGGCALNGMIICDDVARIRHITLGWAGSVHDNRVWSQTQINVTPTAFFNDKQYLLGDSAFQVATHMIPAYKKPFGNELSPERSHFNTMLAKIRIRSEHCIGLLKGRFQYLKRIRVRIKNRSSKIRIIRYILCAAILHNLMIFDPIPNSWLDQDDPNAIDSDSDDELNNVVLDGDSRREQLLAYMTEIW